MEALVSETKEYRPYTPISAHQTKEYYLNGIATIGIRRKFLGLAIPDMTSSAGKMRMTNRDTFAQALAWPLRSVQPM